MHRIGCEERWTKKKDAQRVNVKRGRYEKEKRRGGREGEVRQG
jgi:hypothetical protein